MNLLDEWAFRLMTTVTGSPAGVDRRGDATTKPIRSSSASGIPVSDLRPKMQTRLFQAFFTTKSEGMGMGPSISRTIIEAHGGRIWASSNPDAGATFQFTLPAMRNSEVSTA